MNLFCFFGFTIFTILASQLALLDFNLFFRCFLDFLRNQYEQFVSFFIRARLKSFLRIIFKLFNRGAGFTHYLRMFSWVFFICKIWEEGHFAGPHYYQEILFDQCRLYPSLFQLSLASILYSQ